MSYELQILDCNCNDCKFMVRDNAPVRERIKAINEELVRVHGAHVQVIRKLNAGAGHCTKYNKAVDFIPATCQIHTQHCFVHRKD